MTLHAYELITQQALVDNKKRPRYLQFALKGVRKVLRALQASENWGTGGWHPCCPWRARPKRLHQCWPPQARSQRDLACQRCSHMLACQRCSHLLACQRRSHLSACQRRGHLSACLPRSNLLACQRRSHNPCWALHCFPPGAAFMLTRASLTPHYLSENHEWTAREAAGVLCFATCCCPAST